MKSQTNHTIILSMGQMKTIIAAMEENQRREPAMSNEAKFQLSFDSDWNALVLDEGAKGYQFSGYAECNGMEVNF